MRYESSILRISSGKFTVAISSGVDSIAVAHFLRTRFPRKEMLGFHYHHNLRPQNDVMLSRCQKFCEDFGIPFIYRKRPSSVIASEADLRDARYSAMSGLGVVITAHHLGDATENYLYNCFNGVPEYLPIQPITKYDNVTITRPFIITSKSAIIEYADENNLMQYVVGDETNFDESYRRNWLRNTIIPQIHDRGYNLQTIVLRRYREFFK